MIKKQEEECINPEGREGVCYNYDRLGNIACMQCGRNKERAKQGFIEMSRCIEQNIEEML